MITTNEGLPAFGTPDHAASITEGRHSGVHDALQWLAYSHLPAPLQEISQPFYRAAVSTVRRITTDSPELTTALNGLIVAKDAAMRAGIKHDTGRAGSIPRPQEVVDPPKLAQPDAVRPRPIKDNPQG